jgi:hypothetical protein
MQRMRRTLAAMTAAMAILLMAAGTQVSPVTAESLPSQPITESPEAAVRAAVETAGEVYAGDCASTISPRDAGKVCSRLVAEKDGARAYLTGRTFSEFSHWVFVAPVDGGWTVTGTAALDFFGTPTPPWPGQGDGLAA